MTHFHYPPCCFRACWWGRRLHCGPHNYPLRPRSRRGICRLLRADQVGADGVKQHHDAYGQVEVRGKCQKGDFGEADRVIRECWLDDCQLASDWNERSSHLRDCFMNRYLCPILQNPHCHSVTEAMWFTWKYIYTIFRALSAHNRDLMVLSSKSIFKNFLTNLFATQCYHFRLVRSMILQTMNQSVHIYLTGTTALTNYLLSSSTIFALPRLSYFLTGVQHLRVVSPPSF